MRATRLLSNVLSSVAVLGALAAPLAAGDFNGDGFDDLVSALTISQAGEFTGAVTVLLSNSGGPTSTGALVLTPGTGPGIEDATVLSFGAALAIGDFNADGFDDLAIAAAASTVNGLAHAGVVHVYVGNSNGLAFSKFLHQDVKNIADKCEPEDFFGTALAAGDFDGDGFDDVAVGVDEKIGGQIGAGAVHVIHGSKQGLKGKRDYLIHQNKPGFEDDAEFEDFFGSFLTAGDVNGDDRDDLLVTVFNEETDHSGIVTRGAVAVVRGSKKGLTKKFNTLFDVHDVLGANADPVPVFGNALAVGDFDGDGDGDVVVGAPGYDLSDLGSNDGAALVLRSDSGSLKLARTVVLEQGAFLGSALAAGDFDGDGRDDLAVGLSNSDFSGVADSGAVAVLPGTVDVLASSTAQMITRSTTDVLGQAFANASFGSELAAGDFNGDGKADLAAAAPADPVQAFSQAGTVSVLRGSAAGLTGTSSQLWNFGIFGTLGNGQIFGYSLGR